MRNRKRRQAFNFDEDTSDLYSDIDTSILVDDVKSKEHLSTTEYFLSNRLESKVNNLRYENINVSISEKDVQEFFDGAVAKEINSNNSKMIEEIKNTFINSILVYTGLTAVDIGSIGNVQTSHNMYENKHVSEDLKYNRKDYKDTSKMNNFRNSSRLDDGSYIDGYTGQNISKNPNGTFKPSKGTYNDIPVEHVTSLSDFHKDKGFMIDDVEKKKAIMNHEDNFTMIDSKINSSKSDKKLKDTLGNKEFRDKHGIDKERAENIANKSNKHIEDNTKYVKAKYYSKNMAKDGIKQGTNAFKSAMLGKAMAVIFLEIIQEVVDIFNNGFKKNNQDGFFETIKNRFSNLKDRIWQKLVNLDLLKDGLKSFLSGFLSSIVTTLINMFISITTKIVALIKTAIFSLISTFKIMLDTSKPLNVRLHEASKLFLSAVAVGGLAFLDITFKGLPEWLTTPITALLSGLTAILISWILDQLDLFNAKKSEMETIRFNVLRQLQEDNIQAIEENNSAISQITLKYGS